MMKKVLAIFFLLIFVSNVFMPLVNFAAENGSVRYEVHLQDKGWRGTFYDGELGGTTGEGRRMEAIAIALSGVDGSFSYKVHTETYGWMGKVPAGTIAGTTGQGKRLEAIVIYLESSSYNIKYRVHVQDYGWMKWVESGEVAGTTGQSKRIEAIEIKLEKKKVDTPTSTTSLGIDVSKYQGDIDWARVKNSGIEFAMVRCGYRGYTAGSLNEDQKFVANVKGAYNAGIKVGLYFYSAAINEEEGLEEANYVLNLINKYGLKNYISYPIAYDIEDFDGARNFVLSVQERTNVAKAFCNRIAESGFKPMIYSYTYFLRDKLYMNQLSSFDTWIADYYGNTWYSGKYTMWQYTSKGIVDGIVGDVDLNYGYVKY